MAIACSFSNAYIVITGMVVTNFYVIIQPGAKLI